MGRRRARRARIGWSLAAAVVAAAVLVARLDPPSSPARTAPPTIASAMVGSDGTRVLLSEPSGASIRRYPLTAWRRWVEAGGLPDGVWPVRLGEETLPAEAFDRFGAASLRPGGREVVVFASAYAMLTTVSVPALLGPSGDPDPFGVVVLGEVEAPTWSPDGRYVAFGVGTARGRGVALEVRDGSTGDVVLHVDAERMGDAWEESGGGEVDARAFLPSVRRLSWTGPDELTFVSDDPAGSDGTVAWTATPSEGGLTPDASGEGSRPPAARTSERD